jgi:tetratricopeptide (TPR) repeat protein
MKKLLLFSLGLFVPIALAFCQKDAVTQKITMLLDSSKILKAQKKYPQALTLDAEALSIAQSEKDTFLAGKCYQYMGWICSTRENPNYIEALKYYNEALQCYASIDHKERKGAIYNDLLGIWEAMGMYEKSISYGQKAMDALMASPDDYHSQLLLAKVHNNLANCLDSQGKLDSAIVLNQKAITLLKQLTRFEDYDATKVEKAIAEAEYGLGNRYGYKKEYDRSSSHYQKALSFFKDTKDTINIAAALEGIGLNYLNAGHYDSSEVVLKKSETLLRMINDSIGLSNVFFNLAKLKQQTKEYSEAVRYSQESVNHFVADNANAKYLLLSTLSASKKHLKMQRYIFSLLLVSILLFMAYIISWAKRKQDKLNAQEALLLQKEKTNQKDREAIEAKQAMLQMEASFQKIRHDKIKNVALRTKNSINSYLERGQTAVTENSLIITALHTLEQLIHVATVPLERIEETYNYKKPKALKFFVKEMLQVAKQQSNLPKVGRPDPEDYEDVADFKVKAAVQSIIIDKIIGNAFDNIRQHANCTAASLNVAADSRKLLIDIEDNGIGYDEKEVRAGAQGINNMKEAVAKLGGSTIIESVPGQGTKLTITIPNPFVKED